MSRGLGLGLSLSGRAASSGGASLPAATAVATVNPTSNLLANQVFQRDTLTGGGQSLGQGVIPLSFSAVTTIGTIHARCSSGGATRGDYQAEWVAATIAATGAQTVSITGVDAGLRWFEIDILDSSGTWQNGAILVGMGDITSVMGQSLMAVFFKKYTDTTLLSALSPAVVPSAYGYVFASYQTPGSGAYPAAFAVSSLTWQQPADGGNYDSAGVATYLNLMIARHGVVQGVVGHAVTSTSQNYWQPGYTGSVQFAAVVKAASGLTTLGKWRFNIWYQGHADAGFTMPFDSYRSDMTMRYSGTGGVASLNAFAGTVIPIAGSIPNIHSTGFGPMRALNAIRIGSKAWVAANSNAVYADAEDIAETDSVHESQAGAVKLGQAFFRASFNNLVGPSIVSATRVGTTITVTLSSSSTLVGTGQFDKRFTAYATGSTQTVWPITAGSGSITSASAPSPTLTLTLANDPGDGTVIDLYLGAPYDGDVGADPSNLMLRDSYSGDGVPVSRGFVPSTTPTVVAAPNPAGAQNTPPGPGVIAASSLFDMTATGATFTTQVLAGFGAVMNAGVGASPASKTPMPFPITMEGFFVCPSAVTATAVIQSADQFTYVGLSTTLKMTCGYRKVPTGSFAGANGTTILTAGHLYAYSYVIDVAGVRLYLQDITAATAGFREFNVTSPLPTPVGVIGNWQVAQLAGASKLFTNSTGASIFHQSYWNIARNTGTTFTAPTTPLVGNEANLMGLYRENSDILDSVRYL